MSVLFSDTRPEAEELLLDLLRKTPGWRKLEMVGELYETARTLAMQGLRLRHPQATEEQLRRAHADLVLGPELAEKVCGPWDEKERLACPQELLPRLELTDPAARHIVDRLLEEAQDR